MSCHFELLFNRMSFLMDEEIDFSLRACSSPVKHIQDITFSRLENCTKDEGKNYFFPITNGHEVH